MSPDRLETETRIKVSLSQPQRWNVYGYANNNPIMILDPNGFLGLRYTENRSDPDFVMRSYEVRFESTSEKVRSSAKKVVMPLLRFLPGGKVVSKADSLASKAKGVFFGPEAKTDVGQLNGIKGFKQGKFEKEVQKEFERIGGDTSTNLISTDKLPGPGEQSSVEKLQQAVDSTVESMVEKGAITAEEGEKIKEVYDISSLMDDAKRLAKHGSEDH